MLARGSAVKRFLLALTGAVAGWVVWSKVQEERSDRALWAEVTDDIARSPHSTPQSS